jgi:DNA-binding transcriptional LysR family regulator
MPISTVSRRLSVLESDLGVTLLRRTTRRITLTPQGREYFDQCQEPLRLLQDAERVLTRTQQKAEGTLRVSVPVVMGQEAFLEFVSKFLEEYPGIRLDLYITNSFLDLVAENVDVAIRFGELRDSTVVATRIGVSARYVVVTPEYMRDRKLPVSPQDLSQFGCILLNGKNNEADWDLASGRKRTRVHVSGPISSRDFNSVSSFVHRGHGVGLVPSFYCEEALAKGKLVRLLPQWSSPPIPVFTVTTGRRFVPVRLQLFLKAVSAWNSPFWTKD